MTLTYLLDTSVYSQPLKPKPLQSVTARWSRESDEALAVSAICEAELLCGLRLKDSSRLWRQFEAVLKGRLVVLPFDQRAAERFAELKAQAQRLGRITSDFDLAIAATAVANDLKLATLNFKHFAKLSMVHAEDWA